MPEITASLVKDLREQTGLGMMQCKKALTETAGDIPKAIEFLRKQGASVAAKRMGREAKEGKVILTKTKSTVAAVEVNSETDFVSASDDFQVFARNIAQIIAEQMPADLDSLKKSSLNGKTVEEANTEIIAKIGENIGIRRFVVEQVGPNEYAETYDHMNGKIGVIIKLSSDKELEPSDTLRILAKDLAMQVAATNPIAINSEDIPADLLEKEKDIYREQTLKEGKPENIVDRIVEGKLTKYFKDVCLSKQVFVKDSKMTIDQLLSQTGKSLKLGDLKISSFHRLQLGQ